MTNEAILSRVRRGEQHRARSAERRQQALSLFEGTPHYSYREVGKVLGVCTDRAGQLIRRARKERDYGRIFSQ